ncbi:hypothetical protein C0995_003034 [Termitomyces sp. Mi166|nr:hypothetical protein C0995_003034 [Termitomyces sp. Mi166\
MSATKMHAHQTSDVIEFLYSVDVDVAALIALAACRHNYYFGRPPSGYMASTEAAARSREEFTTHIMYPTSTNEEMIILTAKVSKRTFTALRAGDRKLPPIRLRRELIKIDLNAKWENNELFQVIAGIFDEGIITSGAPTS